MPLKLKLSLILKILFSIILVLIIGYGSVIYWWSYQEASYHSSSAQSKSIQQSIDNGFYIGLYKPLDDSVTLRNGEKIFVPDAWVESQWGYDVNFFFKYTARADEGYHLIIPLSAEESLSAPSWPAWPLNYTIDFDSKTSKNLGTSSSPYITRTGFYFSTTGLTDTLTVIVSQKKIPNKTWRDEDIEPIDTVRWVKNF